MTNMNRGDSSRYNAIEKIEKYFHDPHIGTIKIGHESQVCENIRKALRELGYSIQTGVIYDEELRNKVYQFQTDYKHANIDGLFGPGTRNLLAEVFYQKVGNDFSIIFGRQQPQPARIFISYAWKDIEKANKIDQWLRDKGILVDRDSRSFIPGKLLSEEIANTIKKADKVLVLYSINSKDRDWTIFEREIARHLEAISKKNLLIYLQLDETPLPKYDPNRIAVKTKDRKLKDIGEDLLRGILSIESKPQKYKYDENKEL